MGFGLNSLRQDYGYAFSRWRDRATVRILLIDPRYPNSENSYASQRDAEEKDDPCG